MNQNSGYSLEMKDSFLKEFKESDADENEEIKMELQKQSSASAYRTSAQELNRLTQRKMTKMKVYDSDSNDVGRRTSSSEGYVKSSEDDHSGDDSLS